MAAESIKINFEGPSRKFDLLMERITDEELIKKITNPIKSDNRRIKAARQIKIYFNKIASHPEMRSILIKKVIELVQYEKKGVKNE